MSVAPATVTPPTGDQGGVVLVTGGSRGIGCGICRAIGRAIVNISSLAAAITGQTIVVDAGVSA